MQGIYSPVGGLIFIAVVVQIPVSTYQDYQKCKEGHTCTE